MPGKAPREKGNRLERLAADIMRSYGLDAKRIPLSGSMDGFKGDLELTVLATILIGEAKSRAKDFSKLYQWLAANDFLVIKKDREEPLIVMDLRRFSRLLMEVLGSEMIASSRQVGHIVSFNNSHKRILNKPKLPYIDPNEVPLVPKLPD